MLTDRCLLVETAEQGRHFDGGRGCRVNFASLTLMPLEMLENFTSGHFRLKMNSFLHSPALDSM